MMDMISWAWNGQSGLYGCKISQILRICKNNDLKIKKIMKTVFPSGVMRLSVRLYPPLRRMLMN